MAEQLPINFNLPSESAVASYDYTEIAEGTGIVKFMAMMDMDGNGILTNNSIGSHKAFTVLANGVAGNILDKKFDVTFNLPKRIRGNVFCVIPVAGGVGNARTRTATVTIYHVDGVTETSLGTDAGTDTSAGAVQTLIQNEIIMIKIPVALKHFKKGQILRIGVVVTRTDTGGDDYVGHDPLNRISGDLDYSQMAFHVPFVLNL